MRKLLLLVVLVASAIGGYYYVSHRSTLHILTPAELVTQTVEQLNPLSIEAMRKKTYPGSELVIEQTLAAEPKYKQFIASYMSDGLKQFGLLTIPTGTQPEGGWPVLIFNHGYIAPEEYRTTERYVAYVDYFARNGYIVFKPDYRGHNKSEGKPEGAYYSPAYATDVLNAVASLKKYPDANPDKFGMWGHSMGGNITLRNIVVHPTDLKAAVIWGGVVGSYDDMINHWRRSAPFTPSRREATRSGTRQRFIDQFGSPSEHPEFWNPLDPTAHVEDIIVPVQLHHGKADGTVPWEFSKHLFDLLTAAGKKVEYYEYPGADHDISSPSFEVAMRRSLQFFDTYLK